MVTIGWCLVSLQGTKGKVTLTPPFSEQLGYRPIPLLFISNKWRDGQVWLVIMRIISKFWEASFRIGHSTISKQKQSWDCYCTFTYRVPCQTNSQCQQMQSCFKPLSVHVCTLQNRGYSSKKQPQPAASGLIVHIHGGGFVAQSPRSHEVRSVPFNSRSSSSFICTRCCYRFCFHLR